MYATTLPRSNWLRRASIRLAWYRHMPASSCQCYGAFFLWLKSAVVVCSGTVHLGVSPSSRCSERTDHWAVASLGRRSSHQRHSTLLRPLEIPPSSLATSWVRSTRPLQGSPFSVFLKSCIEYLYLWEKLVAIKMILNPFEFRGSATLNNMKLVHWPLMGGLLHLVQRGGDWAEPQSLQVPPRCTKCNSRLVNGQCTNHHIAV